MEGLQASVVLLLFLALLTITIPASAKGQVDLVVRGSVLFESYRFSEGTGSSADRVSELSLPLTLSAQIGRRTALTVATGYARVSVRDQVKRPWSAACWIPNSAWPFRRFLTALPFLPPLASPLESRPSHRMTCRF